MTQYGISRSPFKLLLKLCVAILSAFFLLAQTAIANPPPLTSSEKAMVHLMLSQTQYTNMRKEGRNQYNYADATKTPYTNFTSDIEPWIAMGARRGDSPNPKGRIKAYINDVGSGIAKARDIWPSLTEADIAEYSKKALPKSWKNTLNDEKARTVLSLINGDLELTDKTLKKSLKAIRKEFRNNY